MLLVTTTETLAKRFGYEHAIEIIANAGFDGYDMSFVSMLDDNDAFSGHDWREIAKSLRAFADRLSIPCRQSHAPFPVSSADDGFTAVMKEKLIRSIEAASILGAGVIVIHPMQHLQVRSSAAELKALNMEFYRSLLPYAARFGIRIATENMWHYDQGRGVIFDSVCSAAAEFCDYIDSVGDPFFTACLDLGHCGLVSEDPVHMIRMLGAKRLGALHIHDNDLLHDRHMLPGTGLTDFGRIWKALAETGYSGDFTFEADGFFSRFGDGLIPAAVTFMCEAGREFIREIDRYAAVLL